MLDQLRALLGDSHVLTGGDTASYVQDWTRHYHWTPLAVVRPANTAEVSATLKIAAAHGVAVVPCSGRTGLVGGIKAEGALMLSVERLNRIREVKAGARVVVAEAGVILSRLHDAAAEQGLYFPLWFGARGSAMLGGALSTNAGGSNVLRYGSTRGLCMGLEVVLADGRVLDLMQELHKDNSGYALKDLFVGSEGTLGIITAAVMKLVPAPAAHATAMLAVADLPAALELLNRLQKATGGLVEAFEFMPGGYMERLGRYRPDLGQPFDKIHPVNILVELGATAPRDTEAREDGSIPLVDLLEETLAGLMEEGAVVDAVIARSDAQRARMWERRESAAEITLGHQSLVDTDICVPLDKVETFLKRIRARVDEIDPAAEDLSVAHLGDGNLHYSIFPTHDDPEHLAKLRDLVDEVATGLQGSFSAEHGIGLSKINSMATRKDPVALDVMRAIKAALDPENLLNPGKTIPAAPITAAKE